jgi:hypothetical protein
MSKARGTTGIKTKSAARAASVAMSRELAGVLMITRSAWPFSALARFSGSTAIPVLTTVTSSVARAFSQ